MDVEAQGHSTTILTGGPAPVVSAAAPERHAARNVTAPERSADQRTAFSSAAPMPPRSCAGLEAGNLVSLRSRMQDQQGFLAPRYRLQAKVGDWSLRAALEIEGVCLREFGRVPRIIPLIQLHPEGPGPEHGRWRRTGRLPEPEVLISIRSVVHRSDLGLEMLHRQFPTSGRDRDDPRCTRPHPIMQVAVFSP
jgi:hypothetical protein